MPRVGFETTIPASKRAKTVHAFFLILVCEAIGTAATPGLLCLPRVIVKMIVEKQMERKLAGETEVLGGNLPQRHFCPSSCLRSLGYSDRPYIHIQLTIKFSL
jgi:hypothetical protein